MHMRGDPSQKTLPYGIISLHLQAHMSAARMVVVVAHVGRVHERFMREILFVYPSILVSLEYINGSLLARIQICLAKVYPVDTLASQFSLALVRETHNARFTSLTSSLSSKQWFPSVHSLSPLFFTFSIPKSRPTLD